MPALENSAESLPAELFLCSKRSPVPDRPRTPAEQRSSAHVGRSDFAVLSSAQRLLPKLQTKQSLHNSAVVSSEAFSVTLNCSCAICTLAYRVSRAGCGVVEDRLQSRNLGNC